MPSKARLLAKSMIESPILSEITTNPTVTPSTITTAVNDVATGNFATIDLLPSTGNDVGDQAFVQATNRLYIWSGSGWYSIALINTTPTWDSGGQPAVTYELSADSPQTATTITLAASDPEGFPITYSHITGGSMDSIATVSQDSSVFTITPKTVAQAPDGGTGSITFRATDGVNILPQVSSFTLSFIFIIDDSKYTTLLATADGTSDNNNITDSSTNNYSITVTGDAHAGTFSPYRSGGYSTYFDGTTNTYLNVSSSSGGVAIGSGDFTISFWVYSDDVTSNNNYLLDYRPLNFNAGNHPVIYIQIDGTFRYKIAGTEVITGNTAISSKQWAYFCLARDNGTTKMYVNGILQAATYSGTEILTNGSNRPVIGTGAYNISPMFNGYISDLRVVTSLDTTAYSVPTERMSAINNTQLLTCHQPYIADGSTNYHSITVNGNVSTKPFSPYDYNEYSATDHGGSVYFVGGADWSSQYLSLSGPTMPSGDFTLSTWAYLTHTVADNKTLIDFNGNSGGFRILYANGTNGYHFRFYTAGGTVYLYDQSIVHPLNQWYYIVAVRDSGTFKFYVNNKLMAFSAANPTFSSSNNVRIGQQLSGYGTLEGYLSDIIYNPTTAITDFTPPTAPQSSTGTTLHIKGTDASVIDKSQNGNLELNGNVTGSTTQVKFAGSKSMYFPGSLGDQAIAISGENVNLSSSDPFTWEAWCYFNSVSGVIHLMSSEDAGYTQDRIAFELRNSKLSGMFGGSVIQSGSQVLSTGQWYHLAISRAVGSPYTTTRFFVNGNLDQTSSAHQQATPIGNFDKWYIGSPTTNNIGNGYHEFNGYMQDVRFTEGLTRYTANFTPPTAPLEG